MVDATVALQWLALVFIFLFGSIWSEDNVRFGYILTAFIAAFFFWAGWIQFAYLSTVVPIIMIVAIVSFLRSQLRYKFGVIGSQGGMIWKILMFVIVMQFAIIAINGMSIFNTQYADNPSNEFTGYSLSNADANFGQFTTGIGAVDAVAAALMIGWMILKVIWSMLVAFFTLYPTMVTTFHVPPMISAAISAGVYVLTGLELFMIIFKPYRATEP